MGPLLKKTISLAVILCFLLSESVFSVPSGGVTILPQGETPHFLQIEIPEELATVEEIYEAPPKIDPKEHNEWKWCDFEEALNLLRWEENKEALKYVRIFLCRNID